MVKVKFYGSLRELYGKDKKISSREELYQIIKEIRLIKECDENYIKILINGKPFKGEELKDGDVVSVFYFGGEGYPGG